MTILPSEPVEARVLAVLDEYLAELQAGRAPDREALLARHPELAELLVASFRALDFVHDAGRTLEVPEDPGDFPSGRVLGDYRLVREIGRGGMAVVYEAEQVSLARRVALKVLPFAVVLDPKQLQRFKNEAQAAAHLHHPHIVPVYAVGCERGVHYYAMQFIDGNSLAVAIRELKGGGPGEGSKTPISSHGSNREPAYIRMVVELGAQAAEALDHAHQLGIVHRDVKPGNLLVDAGGALWITDFGLACSRKDVGLTVTGELLGTIRYMSPEQALARRVPIDHRTDVYSLGATLYELFTLEPAFPGRDPHVVIQDIAFREPVSPRRLNPALPRDVETVLLKAMAKDPAGRYATAQAMADDLRRYLEHRPIHAKRPGPLRRATKWGRRHRAIVATVAGVLLLAVAGLATGTTLLWRERAQTRVAFDRAEINLALALRALDQIYIENERGEPSLREGLPRDLLEGGLEFYEEFARENAHNPNAALDLANAHHRAGLIFRALGQEDRAREALNRAVSAGQEAAQRWPDDPRPHLWTGKALWAMGDVDGTIAAYREAVRIKPTDAHAHNCLGYALLESGDPDGAIRECREALRFDPENAGARCNLGVALFEKGHREGATLEYREALRLQPGFAEAHSNLGNLLFVSGDPDGAIRECREAIRLRPAYAMAHANLGNALSVKGDLDAALAEYREAVRLDPGRADMHYSLACALDRVGDAQGAAQEYRETIRLNPDDAAAHCNLGGFLAEMGDLDGALAEYREAVRLKDDYAIACCNLGSVLLMQGLPREALPWLRKGHELGSKLPDWTRPSKDWVEQAEEMVEFEDRVDRLPLDELRPRNAVERVAIAEILYSRSRYAESARTWEQAFAEDPTLAEDPAAGHRYNAACSASLAAACGQPDAEQWRGRALEWLRAELAVLASAQLDSVAVLEHWREDPDLAAVRDHLDDLPEPEREGLRQLWAAVDEAIARGRAAAR